MDLLIIAHSFVKIQEYRGAYCLLQQVHSDNDASELDLWDILGHSGSFLDNLGQFG